MAPGGLVLSCWGCGIPSRGVAASGEGQQQAPDVWHEPLAASRQAGGLPNGWAETCQLPAFWWRVESSGVPAQGCGLPLCLSPAAVWARGSISYIPHKWTWRRKATKSVGPREAKGQQQHSSQKEEKDRALLAGAFLEAPAG